MLYYRVAGNAFGFFQTVIVKEMFHFVIVILAGKIKNYHPKYPVFTSQERKIRISS